MMLQKGFVGACSGMKRNEGAMGDCCHFEMKSDGLHREMLRLRTRASDVRVVCKAFPKRGRLIISSGED